MFFCRLTVAGSSRGWRRNRVLDANPWLSHATLRAAASGGHGATLGGQPSTCPAAWQLCVAAVGYVGARWKRLSVSQMSFTYGLRVLG